ncbi:hypothetical protein [Amycolatopsis sp. cmx-4-68]|uniref:hypothetical protein n=1 Tax=Amycolatopsis sp. cmx-4-68 TaxID=2790938 RepID=UPI00397BA6E9
MTDPIELSATVPDEPPDSSVVLDRARRAWQRRGAAWYMAGAVLSLLGPNGAKWSWLLLDCGPVIPLWTPPAVGADAEPVAPAVSPDAPLPPCSCAAEVCNGDRDEGDPFRCEYCAALDVELPCPVADAQPPEPTSLPLSMVQAPPSPVANPTGFLGFTDHGHPVGTKTVPDNVPMPNAVARCGGPGICPECARDAAAHWRSTVAESADVGAPQVCASCGQRPPQIPGADDPIGGRFCGTCIERCHDASDIHRCAVCRTPESKED